MDDIATPETAIPTCIGYRPGSDFDEMVAADGKVRPHWQPFARYLDNCEPQALGNLQLETVRRLKEQGVHYNVYQDPAGKRRTWKLDPLPLLISESEWPALEAGLQQRAQLFNLLLTDLYGPQRALREGLIPHELVLRHPEFLRPLQRTPMSALTLYAVDLARGPDGQWWVLADRTQGPSGAGYVLEARLITRRVLGQSVSAYATAPLAQFFQQLKRHVSALAPDVAQEPTIALLSPGIGNEVYFEHAYLAAQLGITLVQGDDLSVRHGNVYLKTVDDLRKVDVLIRRVDSTFCDPLSLRGDSMLGVPGLVQAQALGRVGMANPIGSGVLECPGLLPFLPALANAWLGEDLKLPNVASWWCGQEKERKHVCSQIGAMVIKVVDEPGRVIFGDQLTRKAQQQLVQQIKAMPWRFVGQERIAFSTLPTLSGDRLEPRHLVLRAFLAGDGDHYDVMPGGLTRVAGDANSSIISSQSGGWSKDTWVLRKSGSMRDVLRLHPTQHGRQAAAALTSRAAENLFWAACYLERAESELRIAGVYQKRYDTWLDYQQESDHRALQQWLPALTLYLPDAFPPGVVPTPERLREVLLGDGIGSLAFNLHRALEATYTVRDLWPLDSWRVIEELEELISYAERNRDVVSVEQLVQPILNALLAFWGASQEGMALTQGGLWLQIGRRLERVQNMALSVVAVSRQLATDGDNSEPLPLEMLLEANGCMVSHRRRYGMELTYQTVWQHLLLEVTNPRSLLHQLQELESLLLFLNKSPQFGLTEAEKILLSVLTPVKLAEAREWASAEAASTLLARFLGELGGRLRQLGSDLDHQYFRHTQPITRFAR
jgi:uncharacterized circularly permuted ATP-grasp superfamily protein/uncharacterized alpha-E superfamily protein